MHHINNSQTTHVPQVDRLLRRQAVQDVTGLSRSGIYEKMAKGTFPRPVLIGARAVAWREADIAAWMAQLSEAGEVLP